MSTLQIETARVFLPLLQPARYKGVHGGRGGAKSHFFAELGIETALSFPGDSGEGLRMVCIREVQKSLKYSSKALIEQKLAKFKLGEKDGFKVFSDSIQLPKDGIMIFQGMQDHTADSIKSLEGFHRSWCEEAMSLKTKSLKLLRPTIRWEDKTRGLSSELWFSWNPDNDTDPIDEFLRGKEIPKNAIVVEANYTDNPWFPSVLREEMEYDKRRDHDKYVHVWLGGYQKNSEARVFKNWKVEEFEAPDGSFFRLGADWGYSQDPSVLIRARIEGKNLYIDYEAYMIGCEIDQLPSLFDSVPDSRKWFITADSARPETISYMNKHGYPKITSAIKGAKSVEEGIEFLKAYDIIVHPRCIHTIDELKTYSYKLDDLDRPTSLLEDKHNHVIDALRYACEGARKASKPVPQTVNRPIRYQGANSWMG